MSGKPNSLVGESFGRLTVVSVEGKDQKGNYLWRCRCTCPLEKEVVVVGYSLKNGSSKSCGCLRKEISAKSARERFTVHGKRNSRFYTIWDGMMARCYRPNSISFPLYGGRGIQVHSEWHNPETFIKWCEAQNPDPKLSIDRINNDGNYSPLNCKFSTSGEQSRNRRTNIVVPDSGLILKDHVRLHTSLPYDTVWKRIKSGWTIDKALSEPINENKRRR